MVDWASVSTDVPTQNSRGFEGLRADRLIKALGGDRELLLEIIGLFLRDAPAMLHAVQLGAKRQDADTLAKSAHVLKGSAANFGVTPLYELARELEECAREGELAKVPELVGRLERAAETFEQALARLQREVQP